MSTIAERLSAVDTKLNNILTNTNAQLTTKGKTAVSNLSDLPVAVGELKNPIGTINIAENGTIDVTNYANANVNVSGGTKVVLPSNIRFRESYATNMDWLLDVDLSNVTDMSSLFADNVELVSAPNIDTSHVVNFLSMFGHCPKLENVPIYDTSGNTTSFGLLNMFSQCTALTNESLNNVLAMCINMGGTVGTWAKTLKKVGLTSSQADICMTLSNWDAYIAAGWTKGY